MLSALLWVMPFLVAALVVLYVERVKRMDHNLPTEEEISRNFRYVFDGVVLKLEHMVDNKQIEEWMAQEILQTLINELTENGWYESDRALYDNQDTPFIVQAFTNCGVKLVVD